MPDLSQLVTGEDPNQLVRPDTGPMFGTGLFGQAMDKISLAHDSAFGAAIAKSKGESLATGLVRGAKENLGAADLYNTWEEEGFINADTPGLGSNSVLRNLFGTGFDAAAMALDTVGEPLWGVAKLLGLTKPGTAAKNIAALEKDTYSTAKKLVEHGKFSPTMLPDDPKILRRQKSMTDRIARNQEILAQKRTAFAEDFPGMDPNFGATRAERVARGQERFLGLPTVIGPEKAGEAAAKLSVGKAKAQKALASVPVSPGHTIGDVALAIKEPIDKVAQRVFGRRLTGVQAGVRALKREKAGDDAVILRDQSMDALTRSALAGKLTPEAIDTIESTLKFIYPLNEDWTMLAKQTDVTEFHGETVRIPKGTSLKIQDIPPGTPLNATDLLDHIANKRGGSFTVRVASPGVQIKGLKQGEDFIVDANALAPRLGTPINHPAYNDLVKKLESSFANRADLERAAGVLEKAVRGYFPVALNPKATMRVHQAMKELGRTRPEVARAYSTALGNANASTLQGMSMVEFNEALRKDPTLQGALGEVLGEQSFVRDLVELDPDFAEFVKSGEPMFVTDPVYAAWTRERHSAEVLSNARFIEKAMDQFAHPLKGKKLLDLAADRTEIRAFLKQNGKDWGLYVPTRQFLNRYGEATVVEKGVSKGRDLRLAKDAGLFELDLEEMLRGVPNENIDELLKGQKAFIVPRELDHELTMAHRQLQGWENLEPLLRSYDLIMDAWRGVLLPWVPAYHMRNGVSNMIHLYLAGLGEGKGFRRAVSFAQRQVEAGKLQLAIAAEEMPELLEYTNAVAKMGLDKLKLRKFAENLDEMVFEAVNGIKYTGREIVDIAHEFHLLNTGITADVGRMTVLPQAEFGAFLAKARGLTEQEKAKEFVAWMNKVGKNMGAVVENNSRLALLVDRLLKGDGAFEAAEYVKGKLFYSDELSRVDRLMRRAKPFWMWTRFNVPAVAEAMMTNPLRVQRVATAVRAFNSGAGPQEEAARMKWIKQQFGVTPKKNEDGEISFFLTKSWVPIWELNDFLGGFEAFFKGQLLSLTPPAQLAYEFMSGKDALSGKPLNLDLDTGANIPILTPLTGARIPSGTGIPRWMLRVLEKGVPLRPATEFAEAFWGAGKVRPLDERKSYNVMEGAARWLGAKTLTLSPDKAARVLVGDANEKSQRMSTERNQLMRAGMKGEAKKLERRRLAMLQEAKRRLSDLRKA